MSRFLRIGSNTIHVPSLANVSMNTTCFGYPELRLYYHTQKTQVISFRNYEECEKQMMRVKRAMRVIDMQLDEIPLVEDTSLICSPAPTAPTVVSSPVSLHIPADLEPVGTASAPT